MRPIYCSLYFILIGLFASATTTIECPPDQFLQCNAPTSNLSIYGEAQLIKNGISYSAGLANVVVNRNSCGVGTINRTWTAEDENWNIISCTQTLYFEGGNFLEENITWPEQDHHLLGCDADSEPEDLPIGYREPTFDYLPCSQVGSTHNDQEYNFGPDCKKILRTWTVIDWCNYEPGNNSQGIWTFIQVIKVSNEEPPTLSCEKEITVNPNDCTQTFVQTPRATADGNSCTGIYTITNSSVFADTTSSDASGIYPIGTHIITYNLEYACGAELKCETTLVVNDNIKPVPYCLATLNIVLMGIDTDDNGIVDDGMVEVWAKDLNLNSFHPCHDEELVFSFSQDTSETFRVYSCNEVGTNQEEMWVTDHLGRQAFCLVNVVVQNNGAQIPDCGSLVGSRPITSGRITDISGNPLSKVLVTHKDFEPLNDVHYASYKWTDDSGNFSNAELMLNRDFKVYVWKEGDINRMNNSDVQILEAFIKGEITFTNPYTYIAADLDENGVVDIEDFHLMKNLLGTGEEEWPHQRQYVFYTKKDMEASTGNPLESSMAQHIDILNFEKVNIENLDFIGILKGDLDYYESFTGGVPFLNK